VLNQKATPLMTLERNAKPVALCRGLVALCRGLVATQTVDPGFDDRRTIFARLLPAGRGNAQ